MSASSQISYLSKSKLISAWQCQKKLYLEINHPELAHVSAMTESLFTTGPSGRGRLQKKSLDQWVVSKYHFLEMSVL